FRFLRRRRTFPRDDWSARTDADGLPKGGHPSRRFKPELVPAFPADIRLNRCFAGLNGWLFSALSILRKGETGFHGVSGRKDRFATGLTPVSGSPFRQRGCHSRVG